MTVQAEAVSQIINSVDSSVFLTQPAKSVESSFERYFPEATILLDSNDPYAHVLAFLGEEPERLTTVVTNGTSVFNSLPLFSSASFKTSKIVSQVELTNFDFSIITSLRDLNLPILVSYTSNESVLLSKVAYNLAERFGKPVFHFFAPSNYKTKLTANTKGKTLLDRIEGYDFEDILSKMGARNFTFLNTKKSKDLVVFLGQPNESLIGAFNKQDISLLVINVYKPFNLENLLKSIPSKVETITFLQQTANSNLYVAPLLLDFFQDYSQLQALKNFSKVISSFLGFIQPEKYDDVIAALAANIRLPKPVQNLFLGKANKTIGTLASKNRNENVANAVEHAFELEQAYLKLLQQTNSSDLNFWNEFRSKSAGTESSPETGYGAFLYYQEKQNDLIDLVYAAVNDIKFQSIDNEKLIELLSRWLVNVRTGSDASNDSTEEIVSLLESDKVSESSSDILSLKDYLKVRKNWIIGSDAWSYDLGASGVHNIITSGKNINMLIIDSEPYSAKREESNRFRKKDVGLYAMNYGGCYVASVAVYSSYTQALQAFIEAQKFDGPSVILAYLPYKNEFDDTLSILKETKLAVDSGHWPLYRFNPSIEKETESFQLDSSNLRAQLRSFLDRENKLTLLAKKDPVLSRNITANAGTEVKSRQSKIADESFNKLLQGLSGPPLTIAFASDGGNAEGVAKKLNRQALAKGLKSMVLAMDDLPMEDFVNETNVVFVTSTSGQGEFPTNGKQFWDALKNANDLDLSAIKFSVFGLGDSEYWPRKEDKHYYNKPSKDLHAKLRLYGGVELAELGLGDDQDADGFNTGLNEWMPKLWKALGVDKIEGAEEPKPLTNEDMKIQSDYLRGTIVEGLNDQSTGAISAVDQQLTKFHGIYMQDDRDIREERKARGLEPAYAFMVRVRLPGGIATPNQYLKMDELSDERGNGTLKLTTRATFQLHGVVKHDLKPAIRGMNAALMDTLAACGDVNRNVMISALPHKAKIHSQVSQVGSLISEHLLPETTAYHEIWLEGQDECDKPGDSDNWENRKEGPRKKKTMVAGNALVDYEPLYGPTYLPRKFKIVITVPPYNDVDVYAHDIGLIAIVEDDEVIGFNVVVGGGMGTTHNNKKTYPRTGSMFGFVSKDKVHIACEKIMLVQRDFGDRTNRKHARLKYTIDDMGVDVYKNKVEELLDFKFEESKPFEIKSNIDYFGWCKDEFGKNHFTAFIENGRIEDTPEFPQKTGLKKIAEFLRDNQKEGEFRLTGNQHILISNINDNDLETIKSLLAEYKLDNTDFSGLRLSSAACVAFPTCGLAMAESERYLPKLISKLEEALEEYGLRHDSIVMRMTGCPNGCARPWVAEVALVGKAYGAYNLMLGGGHHGQRLNKIYRYSIKEDEILDILKPLFKKWSLERQEGEPFGDFCIRTGVIKPTLEGKSFHDDIPEDA